MDKRLLCTQVIYDFTLKQHHHITTLTIFNVVAKPYSVIPSYSGGWLPHLKLVDFFVNVFVNIRLYCYVCGILFGFEGQTFSYVLNLTLT